jgi:hypothetical protein
MPLPVAKERSKRQKPGMTNDNIVFLRIDDTHVRRCFFRALHYFPELQEREITIVKKNTGGATMNARPRVNWNLFRKRHRQYLIGVNPVIKVNNETPIEAVPEKALTGWFAHELGHIIDYLDRGGWDLLRFGALYWISDHFRIGAERKADIHAIGHGCADYILATKKYILEHSDLSNAYKTRIEKYYMSPEELTLMRDTEDDDRAKTDEIRIW